MRSMSSRVVARATALASRSRDARRSRRACFGSLLSCALVACGADIDTTGSEGGEPDWPDRAGVTATGGAELDAAELDAAEPDIDELGSLQQALSASCGSSGPLQRSFTGRATAFTATATMQAQGCQGDSYMFAIQSYNSGLNTLRNPKLEPVNLPSNEPDCTATELRFYVWTGTTLRGSSNENGVWQGQALGCDLSLTAPATLVAGGNYKFAIGGRRSGNTLVSVRLEHPYR